MFNDENRLELYDFEHSNDEDRYIAVGLVGRILFVAFVERTDPIRIISDRPATKQEERMYSAREDTLEEGQKPTKPQIEEIRAAAEREIQFNEDCPELSPAMLKQLSVWQDRETAGNNKTQASDNQVIIKKDSQSHD